MHSATCSNYYPPTALSGMMMSVVRRCVGESFPLHSIRLMFRDVHLTACVESDGVPVGTTIELVEAY
eukprot:5525915-Pyramimonas_sp.AAC.3